MKQENLYKQTIAREKKILKKWIIMAKIVQNRLKKRRKRRSDLKKQRNAK